MEKVEVLGDKGPDERDSSQDLSWCLSSNLDEKSGVLDVELDELPQDDYFDNFFKYVLEH